MGVKLFEIACNWRGINNLRTAKDNIVWPDITEVQCVPICDKPTSVLLPLHSRPDLDIYALRDWLANNATDKTRTKRFTTYHRFEYDIRKYEIKRIYEGVNFRFYREEDAFLFKLFYF